MTKRLVEVFIAGCPLCDDTVKLVRELACSNCEVKYMTSTKKARQKKKKGRNMEFIAFLR